MKRFLPFVIGLLVPTLVHAVNLTDYGWSCAGFLYCGSGQNAVTAIVGRLILIVGTFIIALAVVVFFYGAIRMIISRGEEGKEAGKKALIYASLGLVLALLAGGILRFLCDYIYIFGGSAGGGICAVWWP